MTEESMKVRLFQKPDGKWEKVGKGRPVEATEEEVAIWKTAQKEMANLPDQLQEIWTRLSDLLKWATGITAVVTFLTLFSDWLFIFGRHIEIGAQDLVFHTFINNPIHLMGILMTLQVFMIFAIQSFILWLLFLTFRIPYIARRFRLQIYILGAVLLMILIYAIVYTKNDANSSALSNGTPVFSVLFMLGISMNLFVYYADGKKIAALKQLLVITGYVLMGVSILCTVFLVPYISGRQSGVAVRNGQASYPGICIITKENLLPSERAQITRSEDQVFTVCSKSFRSPSGRIVPSIQYLGASDKEVFVLEMGNERIFIVPEANILSKTLINPSIFGNATDPKNPVPPD